MIQPENSVKEFHKFLKKSGKDFNTTSPAELAAAQARFFHEAISIFKKPK